MKSRVMYIKASFTVTTRGGKFVITVSIFSATNVGSEMDLLETFFDNSSSF